MKRSAGCWRLRLVGLVIVASLLSACATVSSERVVRACPPVVEYSREIRNRAATELALLPDRSAVVQMMADYAVMREQSRGCLGAGW